LEVEPPIHRVARDNCKTPEKLAEDLVGLPFRAVLENGAPRAGRHFLFL